MGCNLDRHLQRRGDQQDVDQVVFWQAHAVIAYGFRMNGLRHHIAIQRLAAQSGVQHVARQKMYKVHRILRFGQDLFICVAASTLPFRAKT